jgi:hypothetical protein
MTYILSIYIMQGADDSVLMLQHELQRLNDTRSSSRVPHACTERSDTSSLSPHTLLPPASTERSNRKLKDLQDKIFTINFW